MVEIRYFPSIDFSKLNLRKEDIREIETGTGLDWKAGLSRSISVSRWWGTIETKTGEVLFIWGLSETPNQLVGCPWAVADMMFWKHVIGCQRVSRSLFKWMLLKYPVLCSMVDSRNKVHIKWLKRMGCTLHENKQIENQGVPFIVFTLTREDLT